MSNRFMPYRVFKNQKLKKEDKISYHYIEKIDGDIIESVLEEYICPMFAYVIDHSSEKYVSYRFLNEVLNLCMSFDIEIKTSLPIKNIAKKEDFELVVISAFDGKYYYAWVNSELFEEFIVDKLKITNDSIKVFYMKENELADSFLKYITLNCTNIVGFNSVSFDIEMLKLKADEKIFKEYERLVNHIDLYQFFKKPGIKGYCFRGLYDSLGLDSISKALLGEGKQKVNFTQFNLEYLIYNLKDTDLTYSLYYKSTPFFEFLIQIFKVDIEAISNSSISRWYIPYFSQFYKIGENIMKSGIVTFIQNKGRPRGALVLDPVPGCYKRVITLDFSSMYPSLIVSKNISPEMIDCGHINCKKNNTIYYKEVDKKTGNVYVYDHHFCIEKVGHVPQFMKSLMNAKRNIKKLKSNQSEDLKLNIFNFEICFPEPLKKNVEQSLKVVINQTYGLFAAISIISSIICAEGTTLSGRNLLLSIKAHFEKLLYLCIMGDTDSLFADLSDKDENEFNKMLGEFRKTLPEDIIIEVDKTYDYLMVTELKKNYFGVLCNKDKGTHELDIKGLTLKKAKQPMFYKKIIHDLEESVKKRTIFGESFRDEVYKILKKYYDLLKNNKLELEDYTYVTKKNKDLKEYKVKCEIVNLFSDPISKKPGSGYFESLDKNVENEDNEDNEDESKESNEERYDKILFGEAIPFLKMKGGKVMDYNLLLRHFEEIRKSTNRTPEENEKLIKEITENRKQKLNYKKYMESFIDMCLQLEPNFKKRVLGQTPLTEFIKKEIPESKTLEPENEEIETDLENVEDLEEIEPNEKNEV